MPVEVAIWNVTESAIKRIEYSPISTEKKLEDILTSDISILSDTYLAVGRQISTSSGKYIDILAIDVDGNLSIIELKKNKTPRDVVAQTLDYASWVQDLSYKEISEIFEHNNKTEFEPAFEEKFGTPPPERINQEHFLVIVCSELDNETERIINYLSDSYNVPINAIFFRFFKDGDSEYLSRSWLIDPNEVEEKSGIASKARKSELWNGRDFVVNIQYWDDGSVWKDAVKYGFVSAGGGKWYVQTLQSLFVGARVFAMIPGKGYLGVGIVTEKYKPITEFSVSSKSENATPIMDIELNAPGLKNSSDNPDLCTHCVRIEWEKTVEEAKAFWVKGMSANQNSAFKLRNRFTLEKLVEYFGLEE